MNIRTISTVAIQDIAHQSAYTYGTAPEKLPPQSPSAPHDIVLQGRGNLQTRYQYASIPAWIGDTPVNFTCLMAYRSYEYTKQIFTQTDQRTALSTVNSWLV